MIDAAKTQLEKTCPRTVSCADIIALAARDAVILVSSTISRCRTFLQFFSNFYPIFPIYLLIFHEKFVDWQTGGLNFEMPTGRLDGMVSSADTAANNLVSTKASISELTQKFLAQGLGQDEMITLSGAHTIGRTSCAQITHRLYRFPGSTNGIDPALDYDYALQLQDVCPEDGDPAQSVPLDPVSPSTFDNMYYTNGITGRVLFPSDNALFADRQTQFASNLNSQNGLFWQVRSPLRYLSHGVIFITRSHPFLPHTRTSFTSKIGALCVDSLTQ